MGRLGKTEIISELSRLSPEDLAEVRAWLDGIEFNNKANRAESAATAARHIRSPRLASRAKVADFKKQITELSADAALWTRPVTIRKLPWLSSVYDTQAAMK